MQDFWGKLDLKSVFGLRLAGHSSLTCVLNEVFGHARDEPVREKVLDALKSAGFEVETYLLDFEAPQWVPDPEPGFEVFLPENPSALVESIRKDFEVRYTELEKRLSVLPVVNPFYFQNMPYGWFSLAETITSGFERACADHPEGSIKVQELKEKWGSLRIYIHCTGPSEFQQRVTNVVDWAMAASMRRCAVTGRLGDVEGPGWRICLCKEARYWKNVHRIPFLRLIHPDQSDSSDARYGYGKPDKNQMRET